MKRLLASLALALAVVSPAFADAQTRLDAILQKGVIRVGSTGDYKPFTYLDREKGGFSGMDIDLATELGKALGVKVEFVPTSWSNLMADFEADKFDVAMGGISVTLDRQKKAFFSAPYLREGKTPITKCENVGKFQTIADIDKPGVKAVVNPGGTNERFARANLKQAEIVVFPDNTKIFEEVAGGRADLMMTDASETRYQQKLHPGVLCAVHPDQPFDFAEKAYLLPRDVALKEFVDAWLHIARQNGTYEGLVKKWLE
ncbi:MAG: transporter substrate-binding domain-containing protein [Methylobacteriaceae bacterium]|nr:transporter substrate-binding domain-containing protein [Methylobacteriaceae bacterium]